MDELNENLNGQTDASDFLESVSDEEEPKNNKKKLVIILSSVLGVIIIAAVVLLIMRGEIYYKMALNYIGNNDYESAADVIDKATGEKAELLAEYIDVRVDFNKEYRSMLTDFDEEKITEWYGSMSHVKSGYDIYPDSVREKIDDFEGRLALIENNLLVYSNLRYDITDMMDVFGEINSLIETDADGNRVSFTVSKELKKVERWETICNNLNTFSTNAPNGDTVYLLIYLINETYGECTEIKSQMQQILDDGHTEDEEITSVGDGKEEFPSITNSNGVTLNVTDPETYESYMYDDICTALMKYMSTCYYGA